MSYIFDVDQVFCTQHGLGRGGGCRGEGRDTGESIWGGEMQIKEYEFII